MLSNFFLVKNSLINLPLIFKISKEIVYGENAKKLFLKGVNNLANAVETTLGPKGRNVIIEQEFSYPKITKDGVTVAKNIEFENKFMNLGANLAKQAAQRASKESGDGTTTATLLTRELFKEGCKSISAGMNPMELRKGMVYALDKINKYLDTKSIKIKDKNDIIKVASISANNDFKIGKMISDVLEKIGPEGTINVENGKSLNHEIIYTKGYKINNGFISPYFINETKSQTCILNNCYILLSENKLTDLQELTKILEYCLSKNKSLLIICDDLESEILATLIINKLKGTLKVCVVKTETYEQNKKEIYDDLALNTNALSLNDEINLSLKSTNITNLLGKCKKAIISKDSTTIIEGNGNKIKIKKRIDNLKKILNQNRTNINKANIEKRINKLTGNVALIKVGGINETEINEIKDRIDDSICAAKAAISKGILPGGGTSLLYASKILNNIKLENMEQNHGVNIVKKALLSPAKIICKNAGLNGDLLVNELLKQDNEQLGINALTGKKVDMIEEGIIDPTKVVKSALEGAIKVSSLMLTTEAAIVDKQFENKTKKNSILELD